MNNKNSYDRGACLFLSTNLQLLWHQRLKPALLVVLVLCHSLLAQQNRILFEHISLEEQLARFKAVISELRPRTQENQAPVDFMNRETPRIGKQEQGL